MQPVVFSVTDALNGKPGWTRSGSNICYFKNGYKCVSKKSQSKKVYHTLSFSLTFSHKGKEISDMKYGYHLQLTTILFKWLKKFKRTLCDIITSMILFNDCRGHRLYCISHPVHVFSSYGNNNLLFV